MIIQTSDYVFPAIEPRFSPFWSLQLNIQLVVLFRQPLIISFRGKTFCNILIDQGGRERRCSEEIVNGKIITDWNYRFFPKGMLHPFHLILEIQVKGTGMFTSPWADHSITLDVSESASAISLPCCMFLWHFLHKNKI